MRGASWQEGLLVGLGVRDLVDDQANTALGDDVGGAVAAWMATTAWDPLKPIIRKKWTSSPLGPPMEEKEPNFSSWADFAFVIW